MKASLADQLKEKLTYEPLDLRAYGQLPQREDILFYAEQLPEEKSDKLIKQWEKLNLIRKNIRIVDKYINTNKGETLNEWLKANNEVNNIYPNVIKSVGDFNDETKGISAYVLNLQKLYDEEETKYDAMENDKDIAQCDREDTEKSRKDRVDKRDNRKGLRAIKFKDLKKNDQGYLVIKDEEDEPVKPAEEKKEEPKTEEKPQSASGNEKNTAAQEVDPKNKQANEYTPKPTHNADAESKTEAKKTTSVDDIRVRQKKIMIAIAGAAIFVTAIVALSQNKKQ